MATERPFCTFYLDDLWFGVEVARVHEVLPSPAITPVPLAPVAVAGLVNLRGQILTVIELGKRLGFEPDPTGSPPAMVVVGWENSLVGLLVDQIGEVVAAPEDVCEPAPDNLPAGSRGMVPEVCKFPLRLLHLLDLEEVLGGGE
jgi:purine-binding chemotaxis protein CheW